MVLSFETRIKQIAPISVEEFMTLTVEHYYATRDPFGADGDFTTAPEISQIFGELIGAWAANEWSTLGRPNPFIMLECGPGRGTLMADALRATKNVAGFHTAMRVALMETSPVLKARQKEALAAYHPVWIENLSDSILQSSNTPIILLANEFLDALPIRQFQKSPEGWKERTIEINDKGNLAFRFVPHKEKETIIEDSPARENFVKDVCTLLKKNNGAALFIDYGHTEGGTGDTLQAVKNHRFVPVLENVGEADLTSHVDFAALRRVVEAENVHCRAIVTQEAFLHELGIEHRTATLMKNATAQQQQDIQTALHRLTSTEEMGKLFKVMVIDYVPHR